MGADGHIIIYDYEKIVEEIGEASISKLEDANVYIQEMSGKKYLTEYYGDNMDYNGSHWHDRFGFCSLIHENEPWFIPEDEFERLWEIARKHRITSWEIWT